MARLIAAHTMPQKAAADAMHVAAAALAGVKYFLSDDDDDDDQESNS